jgi:hypothetical protein
MTQPQKQGGGGDGGVFIYSSQLYISFYILTLTLIVCSFSEGTATQHTGSCYVDTLMRTLFGLGAVSHMNEDGVQLSVEIPPPLCSQYDRPDKDATQHTGSLFAGVGSISGKKLVSSSHHVQLLPL